MHPIDFGRDMCGEFNIATSKEWLVTNGIGGYASGTVADVLTRRYHGLLIAAIKPPLARTLLVAKLDASASYDGHDYPLFSNRWANGTIDPHGYRHIERFYLDGTTPVWTYALGDALVQKRIWMQPGANTTYVQFKLLRGARPIMLTARALVDYRDHHAETHALDWHMRVDPVAHGVQVTAFDGATPVRVLCSDALVTPMHDWYRDFSLSIEQYRGFVGIEDHLCAGQFRTELQPGQTRTFVFSTEQGPDLNGEAAYIARHTHEQSLLASAGELTRDARIAQLVLAADQFVVRRAPSDMLGHTVIAGYPWFGDWGRDTMIALPGLTLATGRTEIARDILSTFARFVDRGMLPNRFPDSGNALSEADYNTVDATLWYVEAIRAYHAHTHDDVLLRELFGVLESIVDWHVRGTRFGIRVDPVDGLLRAGEAGVQLTWMDAKVGDWVVTARIGKPVEINALWHNALCSIADFARTLGKPANAYDTLAARVQASFDRFWNEAKGYCYDVIDGQDGDDGALRPNQLLAVSLPHSPLSQTQQRAVVDACARRLITSHGLRSLSPDDSRYIGHYGGDMRQRDAAYHQGTAWAWLMGPFVSAHLRAYGDVEGVQSILSGLLHQLTSHGLGSLSEIADGDAPHAPRGCIAQAWSVAEVLRVWPLLTQRLST